MKYKIHSRINREQLILYRTYKRRPTQIKYTSYINIYIYRPTGEWGRGGGNPPQPVKNLLIPPDQKSISPSPLNNNFQVITQ